MSLRVFGVVAPHPPIMVEAVGHARSDATRASIAALERAGRALAAFQPETIVLVSPHAPALRDGFAVDASAEFTGSLSDFGDPAERRFDGDPSLGEAIIRALDDLGVPALARSEDPRLRPGWLDHASLVPLTFLDPLCERHVVILSLSSLSYATHRSLGRAVADAAARTGRRIAFVASGDLSHRLTREAPAGFSPRARELDALIVGLVDQGRLEGLEEIEPDLIEAGGECGLRSIIALGGYCCEDPAPVRVLAYEGPWGVGYLSALVGRAALECDDITATETPHAGHKGGSPGEPEHPIVTLARDAIAARVSGAVPPAAVLASDSLPARAGAFVSLHRSGELRGCIGTIQPVHSTLGEEVAANAVEAALHDPRFPALRPDELDDLEMSVDVLHPPEPCDFEDLDPSTFGVIVTAAGRRGLLLPDLEGIDDAATQVAVALRKAGIAPGEPYSLMRFKVDRYT